MPAQRQGDRVAHLNAVLAGKRLADDRVVARRELVKNRLTIAWRKKLSLPKTRCDAAVHCGQCCRQTLITDGVSP